MTCQIKHRATLIAGCLVLLEAILLAGLPPCGFAQQDVPQPTQLTLAEGFRAELIYKVPEGFGSWVSLTAAPGGLIASDQYGKLYRIKPSADATDVEPIELKIGRAQGLLWAFDCLYVVAHGGDGQPAGLYRVKDTSGDGQLDSVELLRELKGGGEHGPHAVILSPDKQSLYICAGNHTQLPDFQTSRVPTHWNEDQLLRRMWDPGGHAVGIQAPGGWVCKTDPQGKSFELVSVGFRNQYDIAFDGNGQLFTYDADMEWDIGTTWYRPTRVCHVTSGSEFGWRGGNGKWPPYYPDSLPAVVEIGPGSPTGIVFGTGAQFPAKYQRALFIADWSFGFIYAIHLKPQGGSFVGEAEVFCSAPALQVTDIAVQPDDGAMYFAIGGRRTPSALYRITADPDSLPTEYVDAQPLSDIHQLRIELERLHLRHDDPSVIDQAWPHLEHPDRFVRYAARTALEHQPPQRWVDRALAEQSVQSLLESTLALARCGSAERRAGVIEALGRLQWEELSEMQRLHLLRVYGLVVLRMGDLTEEVRATINQRISPQYPSASMLENRELVQLLVATSAPDVVERTMALIQSAATQEEQIHYVMCLRVAEQGWTRPLREQYLDWFTRSAVFQGGKSFAGYLRNAREEFIAALPDEEAAALKPLLDRQMTEQDPYRELKKRSVVQRWGVDDLLPDVQRGLSGRDLENGKRVFALAQCFKCHRFDGSGGLVGPDLTGLSRRYTDQYLLETLIEPSKHISDQYQATVFLLDSGQMVVGRVANLNQNTYMVQTDMIAPGKLTNVDRRRVEESRPSDVSMMPEDLLDYLSKDEILDLLAYLRSADVTHGQSK